MPDPRTLKRRPFDEREIARLLEAQFGLPEKEGLVYLKLVGTSEMTLEDVAASMGFSQGEALELVKSMVGRGLIIEASGEPLRLLPLHPRMMLTNLFKVYEKSVVGALRERRATVDKIVFLLTPVYEDRGLKKNSG
jgi:sugar-specific transcriptional regulator TrmB